MLMPSKPCPVMRLLRMVMLVLAWMTMPVTPRVITRPSRTRSRLNATWTTVALNPASRTTVPSPWSVSPANPLSSRGKRSCVVSAE